MPSNAQTVEEGPLLRLKRHGIGFHCGKRAGSNPSTPEEAVAGLTIFDVANAHRDGRRFSQIMPGAAVVIGPLSEDEDGNGYVFCFSRYRLNKKNKPGEVSLIVVPVDYSRECMDAEFWRHRMIREATREDGPFGRVHFQTVRAVSNFCALPLVLEETFGRGGLGWADFCDWWLNHAHTHVMLQPASGGEA